MRRTGPALARAKARSETEIVRGILDYLAANRIMAWRVNTGAARNPAGRLVRFGVPGMPDIAGVLPGGRAFFFEVKRMGKDPTPHQAAMMERLRAAGAFVWVLHSVEGTRTALISGGIKAL